MSILKEIVANKQKEVSQRKSLTSLHELEAMPNFRKECHSFKDHLLNPEMLGIIAEFKRKSPSKGIINANANVKNVTVGYQAAGASAISVLTEIDYFNGSDIDLTEAKSVTSIPIIRKDFVVDIFQIAESKALGADAILLIAEVLEKEQLSEYLAYAHKIGLQALIEVHGESDLIKLPSAAQIVGINNRNLNTFDVNLNHSANMLSLLPMDVVKVAESGITSVEDYLTLKQIGFNAFLIGEFFMRNQDQGEACLNFTNAIRGAITAAKDKPSES
jgi:indole-3-glycerol phosphate synthase